MSVTRPSVYHLRVPIHNRIDSSTTETVLVGLISIIVISTSMMWDMDVLVLSLLVFLILPKSLVSEKNRFCVLLLTYMGTARLPLNTLVFFIWPIFIRRSESFKRKNKHFIIYIVGFFVYSLIVLFFTYDSIRISVGNILIRNTLKEIVLPLFLILVYANFSGGIKSLYIAMIQIAVTLVAIGVILCAMGYEGDTRIFEGSTFIIYLMPAIVLFKRKIRIISIIAFTAFILITLRLKIYISSASVAIAVISLIGSYVVQSNICNTKKVFSMVLAIIAMVFIARINYGDFRKIGLPPQLSFKLSLPNTVARCLIDSEDILYELPWTMAVRFVEIRNVILKGPLTILLGEGAYSVVGSHTLSYKHLTGRTFGRSDYTDEEEYEGQFYTLHNISRGLLHYGIIYFIISIMLFIKFKKQLYREDPLFHIKMYMALVFMLNAIWNPYISSLYYQYWILSKNKNE